MMMVKTSCSITWIMMMVFWSVPCSTYQNPNFEMKTGATVEKKRTVRCKMI
jgi:hypothetical protein